MNENVFHVGLCMAGSVSAGAYTAGVMDYLTEALEKWEEAKNAPGNESVPKHQVVIDLLGGTSGGGITSAMSLFALQDKIDHCSLERDGKSNRINIGKNNIFWKSWVELTDLPESSVFNQMLEKQDIHNSYVPSLLNTTFIDQVADNFRAYIDSISSQRMPSYLCSQAETFLTLFNVTGINYRIKTRNVTTPQYISEHRDIAHFRLADNYNNDGRIEVSLSNKENIHTIIEAAKATSAFPGGLRARFVRRKAKYIWDNPFFNRNNSFNSQDICLGKTQNGQDISNPDDVYSSINADGGVANNEPIEVARNIMLDMRKNFYKDLDAHATVKDLNNTSVLLIDPFPSYTNDIPCPQEKDDHLFKFAPSLVSAMRAQLLFDAKDAFDAYKKENYGIHIIAPSKTNVTQQFAIACGSLAGFGGFLNDKFRIHDFFLGRHNCQSFLRKYFVVNVDEPEYENDSQGKQIKGSGFECVKSVINSYKDEAVRARFEFADKNGKKWVPIIPDVTLNEPLNVFNEHNVLPEYKLSLLPEDYLEQYRKAVIGRYMTLSNSLVKSSWLLRSGLRFSTWLYRKKIPVEFLII